MFRSKCAEASGPTQAGRADWAEPSESNWGADTSGTSRMGTMMRGPRVGRAEWANPSELI